MKNNRYKLVRRLAASGLLAASSLAAQESTTSPDVVQLAPVQVTATLRQENLETVPVSVSVVEGTFAQQQGLYTLFDIASQAPSLTFRDNESFKDTSLLIRGIGTVTTTLGADPSVSTVVDGVVLARSGQAATLDLLDVDRVEVLRGAQGTLFGKNASAGVINVVTRDPALVNSGYVDVSYFDGDEFRARVGISAIISPGLASLSLNAITGYYSGDVKNLYDGSTVNGYEKTGGRAKLVLTPTHDLKVTLIADYIRTYNDIPFVPIIPGSYAATAPLVFAFTPSTAYTTVVAPEVPSASNTYINNNAKTYDLDQNYGVSGTGELQLDKFTLTSISAYRAWFNDQYQDGSRSPGPTAAIPQSVDRGHVDLYQVSQELRLATKQKGLIDYVTGVYFDYVNDAETYQRSIIQIVGSNPVYNHGRSVYGTSDANYSAFGEATINFSSRFRAIAGIRGIHDQIAFEETRFSTSTATLPGIKPATFGSGSSGANGVAARAGLQFDISDEVTTYATYTRGYKGPAYDVFFNYASATDSAPVVAETSNSGEVGIKSSTFGNRLVVNVDGFYTNYDNYQTNFYQLVDGAFVNHLVNAGLVNTRGIEADVTGRPTKGLTLHFSAAAIRARVVSFPLPPNTPPQDAVSGGHLPFAPDLKFDVGGDYRWNLSSVYSLDLENDFTWQSSQYYDLSQTPGLLQPEYGIWNASLALTNARSHWRVAVIVKNIGDKSYNEFLSAGTANIANVIPRDAHTYAGINVHIDF